MSDERDIGKALYDARKSQEQYGWREWSDLDERARKKWESAVEAIAPLIRSPLEKRIAELEDALNWYFDQQCEGFCRDFPDAYYVEGMDDECAGCRARATLKGGKDE